MRVPFFNVTQVTFLALNPAYPPTIKRYAGVFAGVNREDTTMTSFQKLFGKAIAISAALSMTAGLALAADGTVSADKIVNALQPKPLTRGLSTGPQADPAIKANEIGFVKTLRNRNTRPLSLGEPEQSAAIAATKPNLYLEIQV